MLGERREADPGVQLTRADVPGGKNRGSIHLYAAPLDAADIVEVGGITVTSAARTVVDVGRAVAFDQAVMTGDAALRRGLTAADLEDCLVRAKGRPGVARARRVARFLSPLAESPGSR